LSLVSTKPDIRKPRGRPTVVPQIEAAYKALLKDGAIDFAKSFSNLNQPLIDQMCAQDPDNTVYYQMLDESTLRKAVGGRFKQDKAKNKSG